MRKTILKNLSRVLVTLIVVIAAVVAGRYLWLHYMEKPWTRDGRVRAIILNVAPDVSGLITSLPIKDNQTVHKGDLLLTIDVERYQLALTQARLAVATAQANIKTAQDGVQTANDNVKTAQDNLDFQRIELDRSHRLLGGGANTHDDVDRATNMVTVAQNGVIAARNGVTAATNAVTAAQNAYNQAVADVSVAELNLARTKVYSTVNGYVTNLQLNVGDYASVGRPVLAVVNTDTLYIAGYFEETKMRYIRVGAPATVELMGYRQPVKGHVESIASAITDRDNTDSPDLVANVNPTFSWVRLAQRIPVRIAIDQVPDGVRLTAGMTATVTVEETKDKDAPPDNNAR